MTENEMVGWHHRLNGYEFEQTQGDSEGQDGEGQVCFSPWGCKGLDMTSNEYSGLISFRIDGLDLLAVQGTLKSLL